MLKQVQGVPRVLICLAYQVSPHDLLMGGISPGSPSSPEALLVRSPSHDLVMGGISLAGSWRRIFVCLCCVQVPCCFDIICSKDYLCSIIMLLFLC